MKRTLKKAVLLSLLGSLTALNLQATTIFKEAGGVAVIEAEHFDSRTDNADGHGWKVIPTEALPPAGTPTFINARGGAFVRSLPDSNGGGVNHNGATDAIDTPPFIDYKVVISTPGDYKLFLRWGGYDGSSDSIYGQIIELNATSPRWYRYARSISPDFDSAPWDNGGAIDDNTAGGAEVAAQWTIPSAGTYTIRITMREDGSSLDTIILQSASLPDPGIPGPAESDLQTGFIISAPPADTLATPGTSATFKVVAKVGAGGGAITYQWQAQAPGATSFTDIATATGATYTTLPTTVAMNGTLYRVKVTNAGVTLTSASASLTTDNTPPTLLNVFSGPSSTALTVNFSEKLDAASATDLTHYVFTGGLTASAAVVASNGKSVLITTSSQTSSNAYTVTINGVKDVAGNAEVGAAATFKGPVAVPGKLLVRKYEGIGGTAVSALLTSPAYPDSPTSVEYWDSFGPFASTGNNLGDNYGLEITGFIVPKVTANYEFYLASDDASVLFLSTDNTAGNAKQIAIQNGCCNAFTHQPGILSSQPIALEANKQYYVRAYLKEGGGGDFIYVGWRNSVDDGDITVPPDAAAVIPGDFLATAYDPSSTLTVTTPPASVTVPANAPVTFSVAYTAYSPLFGTTATVQWQKANPGSSTFVDIAAATGSSFKLLFAKAADSGAQYRAVLKSGDLIVNSAAATLTVSGSVPLIVLNGSVEHRFFTNITVNTIATLRSDPRYPNSPTLITYEPLFEYPPNGGNEAGDNYGNRLSGWLVPPEDGNYVFFASSDDPSEVWLSSDDDPANKHLVAEETQWSNSREWVTSSNAGTDLTAKRSDTFTGNTWPVKDSSTGGAIITLKKGTLYYIEAVHTEGGGGDNVGVAWRLPSDTDDPANGTPPIAGTFVDQLYAITGIVTISAQPQNASIPANTKATFNVTASSSDGSPLSYVWQSAPAGSTNFSNTGGTGTSFTTGLLTQAGTGTQYRVLAISPNGAGLSAVATATVTSDTVAPTVTSFSGNLTTATVVFSEPIDPTTGAALTSYSINGGGAITGATISAGAGGVSVVKLDLSGLIAGNSYTITVKNVKDIAGNVMVQAANPFTAYSIFADFNDVLPAGAAFRGSANLKTSGSFDASGYIELTAPVGSLNGTLSFDDVLNGGDATNMTARFKLYIGSGAGDSADGFSFNVAGDIDPATINTGEEGTGSGLTVEFDTYDNGAGEAPAIDVKWGGQEFGTFPVPKPILANNQWVDVFIQMTGDTAAGVGHVTVLHNNVKYFDNLEIPGWAPITGPKIAMGARTGGVFETLNLDNVIVIYNASVAVPQPPTISITSPTNGAVLTAGASTTITVDAVATAGVAKVEFYANGSLLGQSTVSPYSFTIPATPAGMYVVTAKVTDKSGVAVTSAAVNVTVRPPAGAPKVLFVRSSGGANTADVAVMNRLFSRGMDVYEIAANASAATDASDKVLVVISSTVSSGEVTDKFLNVTAGVLNWENALQDNFLWTLDGATDHSTITAQTTIDITAAGAAHPIGAGVPVGPAVVVTAASDLSWGLPTPSATLIATVTGDSTKNTIYAIEKGAVLIDGTSTAAGRRVHFMMTDTTALLLNATGIKLFDQAIDWAKTTGGTPPAPVITVTRSGNTITITWINGGNLEEAAAVTGPWSQISTTGSFSKNTGTGNAFYRVKR